MIQFPYGARRLALLIGIEYVKMEMDGSGQRLPGCHTDVANLRDALSRLGYSVSVLADDGVHPEPTRAAIEGGLTALAATAAAPNSAVRDVFIGYSGHGSTVRDTTGDERDGQDEVLVPSDYRSSGFITDDWLLASFVRAMPSAVRLRAVFDCCHSGSVLDLPSGLDSVGGLYVESGADVVQDVVALSGCRDSQTSASTPDPRSPTGWSGALTRTILSQGALTEAPGRSLPKLASAMLNSKLGQRPVASASRSSLFDTPFLTPQ